MSFNDLLKFVTQQLVTYLDSPKDQRKQVKRARKSSKTPLVSRWFGVVPFGFMMFFKKREK
ncbi:YqzE family protein [Bacillus salitolerans]|uniref:YqzE family protein n=1 Tax=Bacillus salitolerans TaxID=1437434 RepID=A0ABW4LN48_9BACI